MRKTISFIISILVLFGMVAISSPLSSSVSAQTETTEEPTTAAADTITFSQLGLTDTFLYGPYDSMTVYFSLPSDWQPESGASIQLTLTPSFTPGSVSATDSGTYVSDGVILVTYNGNASFQVGLNYTGSQTFTFYLPPSALASTRRDGRQELKLFLDAGTDCLDDGRTDVIISASSSVYMPHSYTTPSTDLTTLPKPFYMRSSFESIPAVVVIPDSPTSSELQAALTTFAGFGSMTSGNLSLSLMESSQVTSDILQASNLVFVGKAAGLPLLKEVSLTAASDGSNFAAPNANPDDGILELGISPWNKSNVVLVVGGNSDAGVVKAAQALSSGALRPGLSSNLTLVSDVMNSIETTSVAEDRTLKDLGYSSLMLTGIGTLSTDVTFTVPAGQVAQDGSNLTLVYNNSGLLDFTSSGMTVYLNGETIGSQNLSKDTASNATAKINIPADLVQQGTNILTLEVNLDPSDICSLFAQDNLWASFSSESTLHLPLEAAKDVTTASINLGYYPYPFLSSPTLSTTTFVLSSDNPASWSAAAQIAADLGRRSSGVLIELGTVFGDGVTDEIRQSDDLLVVGQASTLPIISEISGSLPAPFSEGSDIATERAFRVVYNLPSGTTIGYLELLSAPWKSDRSILAVLGSNADGVSMAASALTTAALRSQLGGDFAVVNGNQVLVSDSRLQIGTGNISATVVPVEAAISTVAPQPVTTTETNRPAWMGPVILVTTGLIVIILIAIGFAALFRGKK